MTKLNDRLRVLITHATRVTKRFKDLEDLTGITAGTWRSWWNRQGSPSGDMIEAVCKNWPEYAFWLTTGISDKKHGHNSPELPSEFRQRTAARELFVAKIKAQECTGEGAMNARIGELVELRFVQEKMLEEFEGKT